MKDRTEREQHKLVSVETVIGSCVLTGGLLLSGLFYRRNLRRFATARDIPPKLYAAGRTLGGRVVYVGDGDNVRVFHTPGGMLAGWGWLRRVPFEQVWRDVPKPRVPAKRRKLSDDTINVRLSGVDAPEMKHWGGEGQAYAKEAMDWLKKYALGRKVRVTLQHYDQYSRAVARVTLWTWRGRKDVSLEMLRAGYAVVYEAHSASSPPARYVEAMAEAKRRGRGMWASTAEMETPAAYKKRMREKQRTS